MDGGGGHSISESEKPRRTMETEGEEEEDQHHTEEDEEDQHHTDEEEEEEDLIVMFMKCGGDSTSELEKPRRTMETEEEEEEEEDEEEEDDDDDEEEEEEDDDEEEEEEEEEDDEEEEEEQEEDDNFVVKLTNVLKDSKHRDGSIYKNTGFWHTFHRVADTTESSLDAMMLTNATKDCLPNKYACSIHGGGCNMMQIFSLKLADLHSTGGDDDGPVQLYGYIVVRDRIDHLRNYVFRRPRDDPFVVDRSDPFILFCGPRRGIDMHVRVLMEYDVRIKKDGDDGKEDDDPSLIDGAVTFSEISPGFVEVYTQRITGDCGAVDVSLALMPQAMEATVFFMVDELHGVGDTGLKMSVSCRVSQVPQEEIKFFQGVVDKVGHVGSFVLAVMGNSALILDFKVDLGDGKSSIIKRLAAFRPQTHGQCGRQIFFDGFATVIATVVWSSLITGC